MGGYTFCACAFRTPISSSERLNLGTGSQLRHVPLEKLVISHVAIPSSPSSMQDTDPDTQATIREAGLKSAFKGDVENLGVLKRAIPGRLVFLCWIPFTTQGIHFEHTTKRNKLAFPHFRGLAKQSATRMVFPNSADQRTQKPKVITFGDHDSKVKRSALNLVHTPGVS